MPLAKAVILAVRVNEFYYRLQRTWGKGMFLQASVILSTGGFASVHTEIPPPPPQRAEPSPKQTTPAQSMLGHTVNARAVRILLECNLVRQIFSKVPEGKAVTLNCGVRLR